MSDVDTKIKEEMPDEKSVKTTRTHRVGSITVGISMVLFGTLFLLHTMFEYFTYSFIFSFWPVILISMGVELLFTNFIKGKMIFDKGAVVILILMSFLAVGLACVDVGMEVAKYFIENNITI